MLSEQRDEAAAEAFFKQAVGNNGVQGKVVIDKSGTNQAGLLNVNPLLFFLEFWPLIETLQVKYLNNIVEQDHRFIKKTTRPMKGFKAFHSASATLQGIEVAHMIENDSSAKQNCRPFCSSQVSLHNYVLSKPAVWTLAKFATEPRNLFTGLAM